MGSYRRDYIHKFTIHDLKPGYLKEVFQSGYRAAVLVDDPRVHLLSKTYLSERERKYDLDDRELLPWDGSFSDIAENYWSPACGDIWHYVEGGFGYLARKILLSEDLDSKDICINPSSFVYQGKTFEIPSEIVQTIWTLVLDVYASILPTTSGKFPHVISFERLKYNESFESYRRFLSLVEGSHYFSRWTRLGYEIDVRKNQFGGWLAKRYLRDALSVLCLNRRLRSAIFAANKLATKKQHRDLLGADEYIIGLPHFDDRFFSCLFSSRNSYRTDFFDGTHWRELPVSKYSLTILPGTYLKGENGINATEHRVVMRSSRKIDSVYSPNITILLGVFPRSDGYHPITEMSDGS